MYRWHMGVYYKKRGNDEYVYFLAGKKQFFLGRRDDLDGINIDQVLKAANELDKTYDKHTKKYFESLLECMKFLDCKDHSAYLVKRKEKLKGSLSKLK